MRESHVSTFWVKVYVGSKAGYDGRTFSQHALENFIAQFQSMWRGGPFAVTVSQTTFRCQAYREEGWEIGLINYPRFPSGPLELTEAGRELAKYLLTAMDQNRISCVTPIETYMLEAEDAQKHPPK